MSEAIKTTPFTFECEVCSEEVKCRPFTLDGISCLNTYNPPTVGEEFTCRCGTHYTAFSGGILYKRHDYTKKWTIAPFGVRKTPAKASKQRIERE